MGGPAAPAPCTAAPPPCAAFMPTASSPGSAAAPARGARGEDGQRVKGTPLSGQRRDWRDCKRGGLRLRRATADRLSASRQLAHMGCAAPQHRHSIRDTSSCPPCLGHPTVSRSSLGCTGPQYHRSPSSLSTRTLHNFGARMRRPCTLRPAAPVYAASGGSKPASDRCRRHLPQLLALVASGPAPCCRWGAWAHAGGAPRQPQMPQVCRLEGGRCATAVPSFRCVVECSVKTMK